MSYDEASGVLTADGHVVVDRMGLHITAAGLRLDTRARKGVLRGPLHVQGGMFDVDAAGASFDLAANAAQLMAFTGHYGTQARFAGQELDLGDRLFKLQNAWITNCQAPQPDLVLAARNFRYFPQGERMNLAGEGVALRMWDHDMLTLPYFNTSFNQKNDWGNRLDSAASLFPDFGFDAYRGFLTGTRLDFSLGENSRGSVPINFSTGRGWDTGIEHALDLGPGEVHNAFNVETPWATGRGGVSVLNGYAWTPRVGGRLELDADYRDNLNGQPVHRLPDLLYDAPTIDLTRFLAVHNEFEAGYLWEQSSGQQATRLRWAATCDTPIWSPLPFYHTWFSATPFVHHYIFQPFGGFTSGWNHGQDWGHGISTSQTVEFNRVYGETPFIFDRQYDAERLRLGFNADWLPAFNTNVTASWSRINQSGPFSVEDVAVSNTYRWNCFGATLILHPLVYGVEFHLAAGLF